MLRSLVFALSALLPLPVFAADRIASNCVALAEVTPQGACILCADFCDPLPGETGGLRIWITPRFYFRAMAACLSRPAIPAISR